MLPEVRAYVTEDMIKQVGSLILDMNNPDNFKINTEGINQSIIIMEEGDDNVD